MKVYRTEEVPSTRIVVVDDYIQCELCGAKSSEGKNWANMSFDFEIVKIQHTEGTSFPEGGNKTKTCVDLCPACFKNKLLPWLKEQGASSREEEAIW